MGHVAIVTGIDESFVYIGEQTRTNWIWENEGYCRKYDLIKKDGTCTIVDDEGYKIFGWMRVLE